ncbi:hypothetical protein Leryth_022733 [Lithospermum erythrorhizon]|nr:hypothetical protein Leryth_022733 [Lithospermum erythrorhizon]
MAEYSRNASGSSSSSFNSDNTEDDQTIAHILAQDEDEKSRLGHKLLKRLSHLDSISSRLATYGLAEMQIEGDGNCQFRALADQLFQNQDYHKHVRKEVYKQLKHSRKLYEGYVPMKYRRYIKTMKKLGEWGDHVTLQAAADRFGAKICVVTSFRDASYIEILPKDRNFSRVVWLSFWSEIHYNSLYEIGDVPTRVPRKKHWLF